jgi:hypothetical protein
MTEPRSARAAVFLAALVIGLTAPGHAQQIEQPPPGSALRAQLLDAARPVFVAETNGPVEFVVRWLAVFGDSAFADLRPWRPGGRPIDWGRTKFAAAVRDDMFGGDTSFVLLRRKQGVWSVAEIAIGPTDVAWDWWRQQYRLPEALFGP